MGFVTSGISEPGFEYHGSGYWSPSTANCRSLETFPMSPVDLGCEVGVGSVAPMVSTNCSIKCPSELTRTLIVKLQDQIWAVPHDYIRQIFMSYGGLEVIEISGQFPCQAIIQYNSVECAIVARNFCNGLYLDEYCYLMVDFSNQQIGTTHLHFQEEQVENLQQSLKALSSMVDECRSSLSCLKREISSRHHSLLMEIKSTLIAAVSEEAVEASRRGVDLGENELHSETNALQESPINTFGEARNVFVMAPRCSLKCPYELLVENGTNEHQKLLVAGLVEDWRSELVVSKAWFGWPDREFQHVLNINQRGNATFRECMRVLRLYFKDCKPDMFMDKDCKPDMFMDKEVGYPPPYFPFVSSFDSILKGMDKLVGGGPNAARLFSERLFNHFLLSYILYILCLRLLHMVDINAHDACGIRNLLNATGLVKGVTSFKKERLFLWELRIASKEQYLYLSRLMKCTETSSGTWQHIFTTLWMIHMLGFMDFYVTYITDHCMREGDMGIYDCVSGHGTELCKIRGLCMLSLPKFSWFFAKLRKCILFELVRWRFLTKKEALCFIKVVMLEQIAKRDGWNRFIEIMRGFQRYENDSRGFCLSEKTLFSGPFRGGTITGGTSKSTSATKVKVKVINGGIFALEFMAPSILVHSGTSSILGVLGGSRSNNDDSVHLYWIFTVIVQMVRLYHLVMLKSGKDWILNNLVDERLYTLQLSCILVAERTNIIFHLIFDKELTVELKVPALPFRSTNYGLGAKQGVMRGCFCGLFEQLLVWFRGPNPGGTRHSYLCLS